MSKDDNESFEDAKLRTLVEMAPKSGHKRDTYFANILQKDIIQTEKDQLNQGLDKYNEATVNQAIVHTRQDTVLLYNMLSSNNERLHSIDTLLNKITPTIIDSCLVILLSSVSMLCSLSLLLESMLKSSTVSCLV